MNIPTGGKPGWVKEIESIDSILTREFGARKYFPYWKSGEIDGTTVVFTTDYNGKEIILSSKGKTVYFGPGSVFSPEEPASPEEFYDQAFIDEFCDKLEDWNDNIFPEIKKCAKNNGLI